MSASVISSRDRVEFFLSSRVPQHQVDGYAGQRNTPLEEIHAYRFFVFLCEQACRKSLNSEMKHTNEVIP